MIQRTIQSGEKGEVLDCPSWQLRIPNVALWSFLQAAMVEAVRPQEGAKRYPEHPTGFQERSTGGVCVFVPGDV